MRYYPHIQLDMMSYVMEIKPCEKCGRAAANPFMGGYLPVPDLPDQPATRKEYGLPEKPKSKKYGGLTICRACQHSVIAIREKKRDG